MLEEIFGKLGSSYLPVIKAIESRRLNEAKIILTKMEDENSEIILSLVDLIQGNYKNAIVVLKDVVDNKKSTLLEDDVFCELLGISYLYLNDYLNASIYLRKALDYNSKNMYSKVNLANVYLLRKDYLRAYEIYSELIQELPEDKEIIYNYELLKNKKEKSEF